MLALPFLITNKQQEQQQQIPLQAPKARLPFPRELQILGRASPCWWGTGIGEIGSSKRGEKGVLPHTPQQNKLPTRRIKPRPRTPVCHTPAGLPLRIRSWYYLCLLVSPDSCLPQHSHLHDNAVDPEFAGNLGLYPTCIYTYSSSHLWRLHKTQFY